MIGKKIVYAPWSQSNLQLALDAYGRREMPTLYLELSARCDTCDCLYCDSPKGLAEGSELSIDEIKCIVDKFADKGLRWLFICGLGEPSEDGKLLSLLFYLRRKNINATIFTNGLGFTKDDINALKECNLHLILKLDTFQEETFDRLLGTKGVASKIYSFLDLLLSQGFVRVDSNNGVNFALSIVPTALNLDSIVEVIHFCAKHSIYPAIGEMEPLGNATENMPILKVSRHDLLKLHREISNVLGYPYSRPLCPGIISDYRIDHIGNYVVDAATGLGCGWFLQERYQPLTLGNIRKDSVDDIQEMAFSYRCKQFREAVGILRKKNPVIACGGGGRPTEWLSMYVRLMSKHISYKLDDML